jgi:hypothetical protein
MAAATQKTLPATLQAGLHEKTEIERTDLVDWVYPFRV